MKKPLTVISALGTAAVLALSGCGSSSGGANDAAGGDWSFKDDTGKNVKVDHKPKKIVAFADEALALMDYGIKPAAIFGRTDIKKDSRFKGKDLSGVKILGTTYGEIDLEALAQVDPDLIVTGIYPTDRSGKLPTKDALYGFKDKGQQGKAAKLAPIAAMEVGGKGLENVKSRVHLATALGADQSKIDSEKKDFDKAADKLRAATKAKPDIEVTMMYADTSGLSVNKPQDEPTTQMYSRFGATFTDLHPKGEYYWDKYSWENAAKMMTGDVILTQQDGLQAADLKKQATFKNDPALKAGQVYSWADQGMDYVGQAKQLNTLAGYIKNAKDVAKSK